MKKYLLNFYLIEFLIKTIRIIGVTEISKVSNDTLSNLFIIYKILLSIFISTI